MMVALVGAGIAGVRAGGAGTAGPQPAPTAASSPPDPSAPASSPGSGPTELPASGPGIDQAGITMVANARADDTFEVVEAVRFDQIMTRLPVAPPDLEVLEGRFTDARTSVTLQSVTADGRVVPQSAAGVSQPLDLATDGVVNQVVLRYTLSGALLRSTDYPDPKVGRALGALRPLSTELPADLPVMIRVPSTGVLSLSCPLLKESTSCAVATDPGVRFSNPVPADQAVAQLQFNLGPQR